MIACRHPESLEIVKLLLNEGSNANAKNKFGLSALHEAIRHNNKDAATELLKKGALMFFESDQERDLSPFFSACELNKLWAIELFCDFGADISIMNSKGQTALQYTALQGYDNICMYLSLRCNYIDLENSDGHTILTVYLLRQDLEICRKLLTRNCNVNHASEHDQGKTPLHFAIES